MSTPGGDWAASLVRDAASPTPDRQLAGELLELPVMPITAFPHDTRSHPDGCDSADRRHDVVEPLAEKRVLEDAVADFIGRARNDLQVILHSPSEAVERARLLSTRLDLLERVLKAVRS